MYKKITVVAISALALLALSGCGNKTPVTPSASQDKQAPAAPSVGDNSGAKEDSSLQTVNLPEPTGKVDDTVNAIIEGSNKEGDEALSDDNDAKSAAASDSEAVSDTGAGL